MAHDAYLTTNTVRLGPERVVLGHDLAVLDDSAELVHDGAVDVCLLPDHGVVLVVAVVGVPWEKGDTISLCSGNHKWTKYLSLPSGRNSNQIFPYVQHSNEGKNHWTWFRFLGQRSETNIIDKR